MKEVYLKSGLFGVAGIEFVLFDQDEDRNTDYVKDGYRYEWVDNFEVGEKFYTIHFGDAEGNFAEDPLNDYYDNLEDARVKCDRLFASQTEAIMGMYVIEWTIGDEDIDGKCVYELNV